MSSIDQDNFENEISNLQLFKLRQGSKMDDKISFLFQKYRSTKRAKNPMYRASAFLPNAHVLIY